MLGIVPADESPNCGVVVHYAQVKIVRIYGRAHLLSWKLDGKRHYGVSTGYGVKAGDMATVHLPEREQAIVERLAARLPALDHKARLPRVDLRRAAL